MQRASKMSATTCVDDKLDDLLIRSVEKLDSIIALRSELNQFMETGMIDLARARYATSGSRFTISSLSFNLGCMDASKRISCEPASCEYLTNTNANVITRFHLESLETNQPHVNDNDQPRLRNRQASSSARSGSMLRDSLETDNGKSDSSLLDDKNVSNGNTSSVSGYSSDQSRRNSRSSNDPLRWFGVLVPSSLRNSKQCFDRALEILAEVATQQNELSALLDQYQKHQLSYASKSAEDVH